MKTRFAHLALLGLLVAVSGTLPAKEQLPEVSHDGLVLQQGEVAKVLYVRPGVDFSVYQRVAILECPVSFSKDWERDRTRSATRLSPKDLERIKADLSAEFRKIFVEELQTKGSYPVTDQAGEDVLVLRPAIIDLEVAATDAMAPGRSYTLSESAGAMTLYLELYDSVTGQILARAVDRRSARDTGRIQWQNSVTNKAEADRILRRWAAALRERLDEVHGKAGS